MTILHFAPVEDDPCSGLSVAVPQHVLSQQVLEDTALVNIMDFQVPGIAHQFTYHKGFRVADLPAPFNAPDMVLFHDLYRPPYIAVAKELRARGIPYILIPHGSMTRKAQNKKWLKKRLGNLAFFSDFIRHAEAVQCLSRAEKDATVLGRQHFIVSNGVSMPQEKKISFRKDELHMIFIGRLDIYYKGLDMLIEAVASIADFLREHHVSIALHGPDRDGAGDILRGLIQKYQVADIVLLKSAVLGEEKAQVLLDADVFIQTSRSEGMPMGVLEALSYGLPCLLTRGTSIGKEASEAGAAWLAENDVDSIAQQMKTVVLQRTNHEQYSENAVSFIREHYALEAVAKLAVDAYQHYSKKS